MKNILVYILFILGYAFSTTNVFADSLTVSNPAFDPVNKIFSFDYTADPPINSANIFKIQINPPGGFYYGGSFTCSQTHCDMNNPIFPDFQLYFDSNLYSSDTQIQTSIYPNPAAQVYSQFFTMKSIFPEGTYPTTVATLSPAPNGVGDYVDPVTVSLSATANLNIANTYYTIDGNPQQNYTGPFEVSGVGSHTITYNSVDSYGNYESPSTKTFTISENEPLVVGYQAQGTLLDSSNANFMNGTKFTVGSVGGAAQSMSVYVGAINGSPNNQYQMALYSNKTNGKPGSMIAQTTGGTLTANSWNSLPITATLSANTTYWLMYNTNASQSTFNNMYYSNDEPSIGAYSARTYGTWPANYPNSPSMTTQKFSIYVAYLPDGPVPPAPTVLLGNNNVESNLDSNAAGSAEAFQYTALTAGTASKLDIYLSGNSQASSVRVGVYTDNNDNPGTLLSQAIITSPVNGTWNTVTLPGMSVAVGTKYWIAILSPQGSGTVRFRDKASGGLPSVSSNQNNLTTLPSSWTTGSTWSTTALSAYIY